MGDQAGFIVLATVGAISLLLLLILLPLSFQYVDVNKYGLLRSTTTWTLQYDEGIFMPGRYYHGPGYEFVEFPSTFINFDLIDDNALWIFVDSGLEIKMEGSFQIYFHKAAIINLYRQYRSEYQSRIAAIGWAAVKNLSPKFGGVKSYISNRTTIQEQMEANLREQLLTKMDAVVDVGHFQFRRLTLPDIVETKFVNIFLQSKINERKEFEKESTIIRKVTERLSAGYYANITITQAVANSIYNKITKQAYAFKDKLLKTTEGDLIQSAYNSLNITNNTAKVNFVRYVNMIYGDLKANVLISTGPNTILQL